MKKLYLLLVLLCVCGQVGADIRMPSLFSDNAVLQAGQQVPVWGWAKAGEVVTVEIAGQKTHASADPNGKWMVRLMPLAATGAVEMKISTGSESKTLKNLLVGEVWLCSGQSNMGVAMCQLSGYEKTIAEANDSQIRLFMVEDNVEARQPMDDVKGRWKLCTPETAKSFSAVGYLFGRDLRNSRNVPVGLICNAASGSCAEAWVRRSIMEKDDDIRLVLEAWDTQWESFLPVRTEFNQRVAAYLKQKENAKAAGEPEPKFPEVPKVLTTIKTIPWIGGCFFNGILKPMMPYAIKGVVWYQGEGNAFRAQHYDALLKMMIKNWRSEWGQGDFPFIVVQLPAYEPDALTGPVMSWALIRQGQLKALELPNTALVVTLDLNEENDLHPKNKFGVATRAVAAARQMAYGEKIVGSGPVYKSMQVRGTSATITFDNVGSGLVCKGQKLCGFEVAGADKQFLEAQAIIENDTVVVSTDKVIAPVYVRYAWANRPQASLYNKEGFPASPFRNRE